MASKIPVLLPPSGAPTPGQPQAIHQPEKLPPHPGWQCTYDYDDKYQSDPPGGELKPNARVWKVYMDEAEIYDHDMIQGFRETLDVHLVLAALFSAVIVTCAVQTSLDLDPDYAQITAYLMAEQVQLLRSPGNTAAVPFSPFSPESVTHTNLDVWINGLFYTSLSLSLAAALLSALAKQWLTSYTSNVPGDAENRSLHRQFRFDGIQKWKLKDMVGFMPLILHLSLVVFLFGFALFVYRRHLFLSSIVFIIAVFTFLFYTITPVLPAIWRDCPYHNPALSRPAQLIVHLAAMVPHLFSQLKYEVLRVYYGLCIKLQDIVYGTLNATLFDHARYSQTYYDLALDLRPPQYPRPLVDRSIHHTINAQKKNLVANSLFWLFEETPMASIKTIVIHTAISGVSHLLPTETNLNEDHTPLFPLISLANIRLFSDPPPDDRYKLSSFLSTVIRHFNYVSPWIDPPHPDIPVGIIDQALEHHCPDILLALLGSDSQEIDSPIPYKYSSETILALAACYGYEDLTVLLLEKGANPNVQYHVWLYTPPLWEAILKHHVNIAKLLLENGADPNIGHSHWEHDRSLIMHPLHMACHRGDLTLFSSTMPIHILQTIKEEVHSMQLVPFDKWMLYRH